ncbi:MAG: CCA tRNA nucleotidyltransferase [Candidatus Bathyarchaeota archaeon]|nr:MAG: CCA tRNA nucleotidyltransferase [Candidatus Bathyarchaeota archaeon]
MAPNLENILLKVSKKTSPSCEEKSHLLALADKLKQRVEKVIKSKGIDAETRVEGSVAKNTWLKDSPDVDIFIRVPLTVPLEVFGTLYLNVAKKAMQGAKQIERFAEHPYLEAIMDDVRINIVPCYRVEKGEWKSATDRTPFHTDYVKPLLDKELCNQIRLLKQFMKGIGVYGSEIKVGGFSGYLCELLVLFYGSFLQVLKATSNWKTRISIDLEDHYKGQEDKLNQLFDAPLVVVDPVDKKRNAASAVRQECLDELLAATRVFLDKPRIDFFYPSKVKPFTIERLAQTMNKRGSNFIFIKFKGIESVPDILWGQLYKSQRSLRKLVKRYDFKIIRDAVWSDEEDLNIFILELEQLQLPLMKMHLGPPLEKQSECERFLQKHIASTQTLSGPRTEEGRWIVGTMRRYTNAVKMLQVKLKDGGKGVGIAEFVSLALGKTFEILVNEEIFPTYSFSSNFARFMTEYLQGKPIWLA